MSKSVFGQLMGRTAVVMAALVAASALPLSASAQSVTSPTIVSAPRFVLSVEGKVVGSFAELAGIQTNIEPVEYSLTPTAHTRQFGKTTPPTVTLKRGTDVSTQLWQWHQQALMGEPSARKDADLSLQDGSGKEVGHYVLHEAWPAKLEIGGLKAGNSEVLYESVTLKADSIAFQ